MNNGAQLQTGGEMAPIVPQNFEDAYRLARVAVEGQFAPKGANAEQVTGSILTGLEVGLPVMFAIRNITMINGRFCIWGDAVPALLWSKGFQIDETETDTVSTCTVTRPDGTKITRTFSDDDVTKAGLSTKAGVWKQYYRRMRQMRARGFACRDGAADAMGGLWLREEAEDITPIEGGELRNAPEIPDIPDTPDSLPDQEALEAQVANLCDMIEGADEAALRDLRARTREELEAMPDDASAVVEEAFAGQMEAIGGDWTP